MDIDIEVTMVLGCCSRSQNESSIDLVTFGWFPSLFSGTKEGNTGTC